MHAGIERTNLLPIDEEQADLPITDKMHAQRLGLTDLDDPAHQRGINREAVRHIDARFRPRPRVVPNDELLVRPHHCENRAVALDHRDFSGGRSEDSQMLICDIRELFEKGVLIDRNEHGIGQVASHELQAVLAVRESMKTGTIDAEQFALMQSDDPFVFLHKDALAPQDLFKNLCHFRYSIGALSHRPNVPFVVYVHASRR